MIRRLAVTDWRNYAELDITFDAGATFVVASNGVGKTSLMEAARFALFGVMNDPRSSVRAGASQAAVRLEVALPSGKILEVERAIPATLKTRGVLPAPSVSLDGTLLDEDAVADLLSEEYAAAPEFLARVSMPALTADDDSPARMGLQDHLGKYFGVQGLQRALVELESRIKATERDIRAVKAENSADAKRVAELELQVAELRLNAVQAQEHLGESRAALQRAVELERAQAAEESWNQRRERREAALIDLSIRAEGVIGESIGVADLESRLTQVLNTLSAEIQDVRVRLGVNENSSESLLRNQDRLVDAGSDCPVCRRALDEEAVAHATEATRVDLLALRTSSDDLMKVREALHKRETQVLSLLQALRDIPADQSKPSFPDVEGAMAGALDIDSARAAENEALTAVVTAQSVLQSVESELDAAREADRAMRELELLLRRQAVLQVARDTTTGTLTAILNGQVKPLTAEINSRWSALFPDRGTLTTLADGSVTRTVNDQQLSFDDFSAGESVALRLVVRLLVAQMASALDFCWFDEPLESLDPDARRQVANLLTRVSDGGSQIRQVVITTYEEPLARRLAARDPKRVHLVDIRQ